MTRRSATPRRIDAASLAAPTRQVRPKPRRSESHRQAAAPTYVRTTPASFRRQVVAWIEEERLAERVQWEYGLPQLPDLSTPFWQEELHRRRTRNHRGVSFRVSSRNDHWGASGASVAEALATGVKLNTTIDERKLAEQIAAMERQLERFADTGIVNLTPFLPLLFQLNGKPFHIRDHFLFEPFFTLRMCSSMLWKTGRQVAKTIPLTGDSRLQLANGRRVRGQDVKIGDRVLSLGPNGRWTTVKVLDTIRSRNKPCLRITTRMGVTLDIATTHPLLRYDGWTRGGQLKVGDRICALRRGGEFGRRKLPAERLVLTAYVLGGGHCVTNIGLTSECEEVLREWSAAVENVEGRLPPPILKDGNAAVRVDAPINGRLRRWLEADGIYGKRCYEKRLPDWAFQLSRRDAALFLSRLWATDGSVKQDKTKPQLTYSSTSRDLAFDVKALLLKFGIPASVSRKKAGYRKPGGEYVPCRDAYVVRVETREGWQRFLDSLDVPGKPGFPLRDVAENNNRDTVPLDVCELIADLAGECRGTAGHSLYQAGLRKKPKYPPSRRKLAQYLALFREHRCDHPRLPELERLVEGDMLWDEIVSIEPLGDHDCWDIEVDGDHNYILDGVVSHNSTSQAVQGILCSLLIPYFNTLFVTPLYEMIRRFSVNYVKPFIDNSFIRNLLIDGSCMNNVLQRTFRNQSTMFFSFALLDANRTRGLNCAKNAFDEAQDMDPANIPIIKETMSASRWNITQMTGTPKTLEGILEQEWLKSSMAEWVVPCDCGYYNVPSLERDLDAMLGPTNYDREVSEEAPGVVCASCKRPVNPRQGFWYHANEQLRYDRDGRHVPQCLLPMHYADPRKWAILIGKREGWGNTPKNVFYNECCGESYDAGARMLTVTDIKRAATLHENRLENALAAKHNYLARALGVDWGGGGKDWTSFTTAAVLGLRYDGRVDVIYGWRSLRPHAYYYEAAEIYRLYQDFECELVAHDFTGWGALREDYLNKAGVPLGRLWPISYIRTSSGAMMRQVPLDLKTGKRMHFQLDKARSLMMIFELIRKGFIHTFAYDHYGDGREGLLHDLLNLVADKIDSRTGSELMTIIRDEKAGPDDFAHSINVGTMALFMSRNHWPDVGILRQFEADEKLLEQLHPDNPSFDYDIDPEG